MINSGVVFVCSNRDIKNDKRAFLKFLLNNRGRVNVLRNICMYIRVMQNF